MNIKCIYARDLECIQRTYDYMQVFLPQMQRTSRWPRRHCPAGRHDWDSENNPCASVGTPSSSYPSRSPSPERIVMSTEELRHSEASRKLQASQNLQGLIEAIRAERIEEGLQHQRASNAARARRARAIYECNMQKWQEPDWHRHRLGSPTCEGAERRQCLQCTSYLRAKGTRNYPLRDKELFSDLWE